MAVEHSPIRSSRVHEENIRENNAILEALLRETDRDKMSNANMDGESKYDVADSIRRRDWTRMMQ